MSNAVTIERRFRGPSESGQGGYSCGLLARAIDAPAAEVTLRAPPPSTWSSSWSALTMAHASSTAAS
jgi:hypothetical protein